VALALLAALLLALQPEVATASAAEGELA